MKPSKIVLDLLDLGGGGQQEYLNIDFGITVMETLGTEIKSFEYRDMALTVGWAILGPLRYGGEGTSRFGGYWGNGSCGVLLGWEVDGPSCMARWAH